MTWIIFGLGYQPMDCLQGNQLQDIAVTLHQFYPPVPRLPPRLSLSSLFIASSSPDGLDLKSVLI